MTDPVTITLAGEPVGKGRPRIGRGANGRAMAFTPTKTRGAEAYLKLQAALEMKGRELLDGPLELSMRAVLSIPRSWPNHRQGNALLGIIKPTGRPDLDNYAKLVADSLNGIVYRDDSAIVSMQLSKAYGPQPCLVITVRVAQ